MPGAGSGPILVYHLHTVQQKADKRHHKTKPQDTTHQMVQDAQRRRSHDTSQNLTRQQYDTHDQQETRHIAEHRHSLFGKPAQCQYISTQPKCRLRTKKIPTKRAISETTCLMTPSNRPFTNPIPARHSNVMSNQFMFTMSS